MNDITVPFPWPLSASQLGHKTESSFQSAFSLNINARLSYLNFKQFFKLTARHFSTKNVSQHVHIDNCRRLRTLNKFRNSSAQLQVANVVTSLILVDDRHKKKPADYSMNLDGKSRDGCLVFVDVNCCICTLVSGGWFSCVIQRKRRGFWLIGLYGGWCFFVSEVLYLNIRSHWTKELFSARSCEIDFFFGS